MNQTKNLFLRSFVTKLTNRFVHALCITLCVFIWRRPTTPAQNFCIFSLIAASRFGPGRKNNNAFCRQLLGFLASVLEKNLLNTVRGLIRGERFPCSSHQSEQLGLHKLFLSELMVIWWQANCFQRRCFRGSTYLEYPVTSATPKTE